MSLTLREFRAEDRQALADLWSLAFAGGRPVPEHAPLCGDSDRISVAEESGRIVGGYLLRDLRLTRGGALLKCGGLAYMTVAPECRGRGIGVELMRHALETLRAGGWHLTSGYATREGIYRKFGWECAGRRVQIECPSNRFPRLECTLPIRRLSVHDWPLLEPAYAGFSRGYAGMAMRRDLRFSRGLFPLLGLGLPGIEPIVLAAGDPVEAYAILPICDANRGTQDVSELVWSTPAGYRSILSAVFAFAADRDSVTWFEPSDGPFFSFGLDSGVECRLMAHFGPRIINVRSAIEALRPTESGSFSLSVRDAEIAHNRGPWRIDFSPERVEVERCESADVEMPPGPFVQALLGEPSLDILARQGFATSKTEQALRDAAKLFAAFRTYCLDFF